MARQQYPKLPSSELTEIRKQWVQNIYNAGKLSHKWLMETDTGNMSILGHLLLLGEQKLSTPLKRIQALSHDVMIFQWRGHNYDCVLPEPWILPRTVNS